jgi:hypothetical protein
MRRMLRQLLLACLVTTAPALLLAQAPRDAAPRRNAFGFSYVTYAVEDDDGVFTDASEHLTTNFGFRFSKAFVRPSRALGWMVDGELFLGVIDRELLDVPLPETMFGLHAFVGPQFRSGRLTTYVAAGINRTTVPETELVSTSRGAAIQYIGRGGLSRLWAATLNNLTSSGQPTVSARIEGYNKLAPAGMLGASYDVGRGPMGLRLSADYLPMFGGSVRHNVRVSLFVTGG